MSYFYGLFKSKPVEIKYTLQNDEVLHVTDIDKISTFNNPELILNMYFENGQIQNLPDFSIFKNLNLIGFKNIIFEDKMIRFNLQDMIKKLILINTNLNDIAHSLSNTKINYLKLENCDSNISNISNITSLEEIYITNNAKFTTLEPFSKLPNLKILDLEDNSLLSVSHVQNLKTITKLNIQKNCITDINLLSELNNLEELIISNNKIEKLPNFEKLTKLKTFKCNSNKINNFDEILKLEQLEQFEMLNNPCTILPNITKLVHLNYDKLQINWNNIKIFDGIKNFGLMKNMLKCFIKN